MQNKPNPGSDEAVAAGCTCPVMDNARVIRSFMWTKATKLSRKTHESIAANAIVKGGTDKCR